MVQMQRYVSGFSARYSEQYVLQSLTFTVVFTPAVARFLCMRKFRLLLLHIWLSVTFYIVYNNTKFYDKWIIFEQKITRL